MLLTGKRCTCLTEEDEVEGSVPTEHQSSRRELLSLRANPQRLRKIFGKSAARAWEVSIVFLAMCFAWCSYFSTKWMIAGVGVFTHVSCFLAISHALFLSVACFLWIWIVDKIDDFTRERRSGEELTTGLELMIRAIGILVGFAWEQSFDIAVGTIAESTPHKSWAKFALAVFSVGIVAPAWRLYLAPMVLDGWRFGFVAHYVVEKARELTISKNELRAAEFVAEYRKLLHQLQTVHHTQGKEPHIDVTTAVFDQGLDQLCLASTSQQFRSCSWQTAQLRSWEA